MISMFNSVFLFMNIGGPEMILIFLVVLLLFGGKKLPELARGLGKGLREFKDASDGIKREIHNNINAVNEVVDAAKSEVQSAANSLDTEGSPSTSYSNPDEDVLEHGYASQVQKDDLSPENESVAQEDVKPVNNTDESGLDITDKPDLGITNKPDDSGIEQTKIAH